MSVPSTVDRIEYTGNGSSVTPYPVPFLFFENSHLVVYLDYADQSSTPLILGTHYTVTGAEDPDGGSVVTVAAYSSAHKLRIDRVVPLTQLTTYTVNGDFPAASHERALDKLTMAVQQTGRRIEDHFEVVSDNE